MLAVSDVKNCMSCLANCRGIAVPVQPQGPAVVLDIQRDLVRAAILGGSAAAGSSANRVHRTTPMAAPATRARNEIR